jgi:hypothetical protein
MWQFALPALKAIGINAGINAIRRKPLFENAATAGVTGGVLGGFSGGGGLFSSSPSPLSAGGISNGAVTNALAGGDVAKGLAINGSALAGSIAIPSATAGSSYIPGSIESVMGPATASGTYLDKDYFANILGSPVYTGNEGLLSQIGTGASSIFDTAKAELGDSITPQNLIGVSNILSNMANAPRPVANMGGSQITGTPPKFEPFQTGQVYTRKRGNR